MPHRNDAGVLLSVTQWRRNAWRSLERLRGRLGCNLAQPDKLSLKPGDQCSPLIGFSLYMHLRYKNIARLFVYFSFIFWTFFFLMVCTFHFWWRDIRENFHVMWGYLFLHPIKSKRNIYLEPVYPPTATRHPPPATRHPVILHSSPVNLPRHPWKSLAVLWQNLITDAVHH